MVSVSKVFAQQFADRRATRRVAPLSQARIEIELGGDTVERHEKGEDVEHQCASSSSRLANWLAISALGRREARRTGTLWLLREQLVRQSTE
jgi:hypothetical protein